MKRRLNIAIFDGSLTTTTFISRLVHGLAERHQVSLIGFGGTPNQDLKDIQYYNLGSSSSSRKLFLKSLGISVQILVRTGRFLPLIKTFLGIMTNQKDQLKQQNFNSVLQLIKPNVLHVQWPSLLNYCQTAITNSDIRVILSQRGYQTNVRPFVRTENFNFLTSIYPKLDGFHSVSREMVVVGNSIYNSQFKIDRVVYTGFNFSKLTFRENYEKNNPLAILSIGRPHWIKGYDLAIQACKILKDLGLSFRYTIVGASANEELCFRIHQSGLGNYIKLTDKITQHEVYELMRNHDVLLFPSIKEGYPNVVVEAMAIGLPVIATDCGGVAELIDNLTGALIPPRDPQAMATALATFFDKPLESIQTQRLEARRRVESKHNEEQMVRGMESLYDEVLKINV